MYVGDLKKLTLLDGTETIFAIKDGEMYVLPQELLRGTNGENGTPGLPGVNGTNGSNGILLKRGFMSSGAVATGTTVIPWDDTIPEKTEGTEFMTLDYTPLSATNILRIEANISLTFNNTNAWLIASLFKDTDTYALSSAFGYMYSPGTTGQFVNVVHEMVAGTTSSITFKVRAGTDVAGTTTFNGQVGGRKLGGVMGSNITITEYTP